MGWARVDESGAELGGRGSTHVQRCREWVEMAHRLRPPGRRLGQRHAGAGAGDAAAVAVAAHAVEASAGGAVAALRRDVDELRAHRAEAASGEAEARGVRAAFAGWVRARAPGL